MIVALTLASVLIAQRSQDLWVVTENNAREAILVNVGSAEVSEDGASVVANVHIVEMASDGGLRRSPRAYTGETVTFRCADRTYRVVRSGRSSGDHDPTRMENPDAAFVSIETDPRRQRQADAACRPRNEHTAGYAHPFAFMQAEGLSSREPATPPLPGPRPYPTTPADREQAAREPERPYPPRIGMQASWAHNPGGGLVIGYAGYRLGGRWVSEFYSMGAWASNPAAEPIVFVRRALDAWQAQEQVQWADSRTCPGLVAAMLPANDLPVPIIILPLDEASRFRIRDSVPSHPPAPDGNGAHIFWTPARGSVASDVQFSTHGGPWVDWAQSVDRVLEPCWQNDRPVRPPMDYGF